MGPMQAQAVMKERMNDFGVVCLNHSGPPTVVMYSMDANTVRCNELTKMVGARAYPMPSTLRHSEKLAALPFQ